MGKFGKVVERGDNRKWLKTDPKPNLLTITTGPPPYKPVVHHYIVCFYSDDKSTKRISLDVLMFHLCFYIGFYKEVTRRVLVVSDYKKKKYVWSSEAWLNFEAWLLLNL